jgi:Holliday junction DNA helicase RuvA
MIAYLAGTLTQLQPSHALVECNGVGYQVLISLTTYEDLKPHAQQAVKVLTQFVVRETDQLLFGFSTPREREVFRQLTAISGIGGSTALTILGSLRPDELERAIEQEDVKRIQSVKGVGPKTAARVVLELKGKLPKLGTTDGTAPAPDSPGGRRAEALEALVTLGFPRAAMDKKLDELLRGTDAPLTVEALIKAALKG